MWRRHVPHLQALSLQPQTLRPDSLDPFLYTCATQASPASPTHETACIAAASTSLSYDAFKIDIFSSEGHDPAAVALTHTVDYNESIASMDYASDHTLLVGGALSGSVGLYDLHEDRNSIIKVTTKMQQCFQVEQQPSQLGSLWFAAHADGLRLCRADRIVRTYAVGEQGPITCGMWSQFEQNMLMTTFGALDARSDVLQPTLSYGNLVSPHCCSVATSPFFSFLVALGHRDGMVSLYDMRNPSLPFASFATFCAQVTALTPSKTHADLLFASSSMADFAVVSLSHVGTPKVTSLEFESPVISIVDTHAKGHLALVSTTGDVHSVTLTPDTLSAMHVPRNDALEEVERRIYARSLADVADRIWDIAQKLRDSGRTKDALRLVDMCVALPPVKDGYKSSPLSLNQILDELVTHVPPSSSTFSSISNPDANEDGNADNREWAGTSNGHWNSLLESLKVALAMEEQNYVQLLTLAKSQSWTSLDGPTAMRLMEYVFKLDVQLALDLVVKGAPMPHQLSSVYGSDPKDQAASRDMIAALTEGPRAVAALVRKTYGADDSSIGSAFVLSTFVDALLHLNLLLDAALVLMAATCATDYVTRMLEGTATNRLVAWLTGPVDILLRLEGALRLLQDAPCVLPARILEAVTSVIVEAFTKAVPALEQLQSETSKDSAKSPIVTPSSVTSSSSSASFTSTGDREGGERSRRLRDREKTDRDKEKEEKREGLGVVRARALLQKINAVGSVLGEDIDPDGVLAAHLENLMDAMDAFVVSRSRS